MYGVIDLGSNTVRLVLYKVIDNTIEPKLSKNIRQAWSVM